MQGHELLIPSIGLGAFYELMFSGWELARERRWSFQEIAGNLVSNDDGYSKTPTNVNSIIKGQEKNKGNAGSRSVIKIHDLHIHMIK
eukprot:scaffold116354_cov65-Cyclotella_meneghiniana.AAC.5